MKGINTKITLILFLAVFMSVSIQIAFIDAALASSNKVKTVDEAIQVLVEKIRASFVAKEGKIATVSGETAYINIGLANRVKVGDEFEVVRYGNPLKASNGEIIGYEETYLGKIKVEKVRNNKLSICKILEKNDEIKPGDVALSVARKVRIAMSSFSGTNPSEHRFC